MIDLSEDRIECRLARETIQRQHFEEIRNIERLDSGQMEFLNLPV